MHRAINSPSLAEQTRRRVSLRLMPFIFLLFLVAFLDRVNVGFAALQMTRDLGFTGAVFGFGGGIFFIGYFVLEIPGAIFAEVWSARKWLAHHDLLGIGRPRNRFHPDCRTVLHDALLPGRRGGGFCPRGSGLP